MQILDTFYSYSGKTTVCTILSTDGRDLSEDVGVSNRHPNDRDDKEIGRELAHSRALRKFARRVERQANGKMKFKEGRSNWRSSDDWNKIFTVPINSRRIVSSSPQVRLSTVD